MNPYNNVYEVDLPPGPAPVFGRRVGGEPSPDRRSATAGLPAGAALTRRSTRARIQLRWASGVLPRVARDPRRGGPAIALCTGRNDVRHRARDGAIGEGGEPGTRRSMAGSGGVQNIRERPVPVEGEDRGVLGVLVLGERGLVETERFVSRPPASPRQEGVLPGGRRA